MKLVVTALAVLAFSTSALAAGKAAQKPAQKKGQTDWEPTPAMFHKFFNKANWPKLQGACKKAFVEESCEFLRAAHDYRALKADNIRGAMAERIVDNYIGGGKPKEVNLPAAIADKTLADYAKAKRSKKFPVTLFKAAEDEIMKVQLDNARRDARATFEPVLKSVK